MEWILHIGTNKTGSTAIQRYLSHSLPKELASKICYPVSGRQNIHHLSIVEELRGGESQKLEMAVKEGNESSADIGIISSEAFFTLTSEQIETIFRVLGQAKVVLFIRRQDQLANSRYNQLVKSPKVNIDTIRKFESNIERYNPNWDHMLTVKSWGEVFGMENIVPIIYDKNTSAIEKLFSHIGLDYIPVHNKQQSKNTNPALNFEALKVFKAIKERNKNDEDLPYLIDVARGVLKNSLVDTYSEGDQYLLSMPQRQAICKWYIDSNTELKRTFFPEKERLFPELEFKQVDTSDDSVDEDLVSMILHKSEKRRTRQLMKLKRKLALLYYSSQRYRLSLRVTGAYWKIRKLLGFIGIKHKQ